MTKSNPQNAVSSIVKSIVNKYPKTQAIFWTGSVSPCEGKPNSDLDFVVLLTGDQPLSKHIHAQYGDWPVDIWVSSEFDMDNRNYTENHMIANSKIVHDVDEIGQKYQ